MAFAIRVENLSKLYRLGTLMGSYATLRDAIASAAQGVTRRLKCLRCADDSDGLGKRQNEIWALRDVSLEIQEGDAIGIVGRNGAGKSTFLKILSRITPPTRGRVIVCGRVGSLLEVGTGFHQELTGRENIYLNGAILGMSSREIRRRFDEIVAFAGVEKFIDTPTKRYSSGMYMRLAFAVAAHLDPDILLVDEVLAVGDYEFQQKCMGKLQDSVREGRTVIFVSHSVASVRSLTRNCIYLDQGRLAAFGPTAEVIDLYTSDAVTRRMTANGRLADFRTCSGDQIVQFEEITLLNQYSCANPNKEGLGLPVIEPGDPIELQMRLRCTVKQTYGHIIITLTRESHQPLATLYSGDSREPLQFREGVNIVRCRVPGLPLSPGRFFGTFRVWRAARTRSWDILEEVPLWETNATDVLVGKVEYPERLWGPIHIPTVEWSCEV